jgi:hypothetical protein
MPSVEVFVVCHDEAETLARLREWPGFRFVFVGPWACRRLRRDPRVIVARTLPDNIEHERELLTFTAWYGLVMNGLLKTDHACLLEYDVTVPEPAELKSRLGALLEREPADVVSFSALPMASLCERDVAPERMREVLRCVGLGVSGSHWYPTSNQCVAAPLLRAFVDWYYPTCVDVIRRVDPDRLSWYQERLFSLFVNARGIRVQVEPGLVQHVQLGSHIQTLAAPAPTRWGRLRRLLRPRPACRERGG